MEAPHQLACHECDLLLSLPKLEVGHRAACPRCGHVISRNFSNAQAKLFAFAVSALIFLLLSLPYPFLSLSSQGSERTVTIFQSLQSLGSGDLIAMSVMLLLTTVLIPFGFIIGVLYVLSSLRLSRPLPYTRQVLRLVFLSVPWNMAEIFLVGILVSFIKVVSLADVSLGLSFIAFSCFIVCLTATTMHLDKFQIWQLVRRHHA